MKSIHGTELFNFVASFREDARFSRRGEEDLPVPEWASHLREVAHKHFGVSRQTLDASSDEQVISALGYAGMTRVQSRYHAQRGMAFITAAVVVPFLLSSGPLYPLVFGAYGLYNLSAAAKDEKFAFSSAKRGERELRAGSPPSRSSKGRLILSI